MSKFIGPGSYDKLWEINLNATYCQLIMLLFLERTRTEINYLLKELNLIELVFRDERVLYDMEGDVPRLFSP